MVESNQYKVDSSNRTPTLNDKITTMFNNTFDNL